MARLLLAVLLPLALASPAPRPIFNPIEKLFSLPPFSFFTGDNDDNSAREAPAQRPAYRFQGYSAHYVPAGMRYMQYGKREAEPNHSGWAVVVSSGGSHSAPASYGYGFSGHGRRAAGGRL
jgi:hypothetical protein